MMLVNLILVRVHAALKSVQMDNYAMHYQTRVQKLNRVLTLMLKLLILYLAIVVHQPVLLI